MPVGQFVTVLCHTFIFHTVPYCLVAKPSFTNYMHGQIWEVRTHISVSGFKICKKNLTTIRPAVCVHCSFP